MNSYAVEKKEVLLENIRKVEIHKESVEKYLKELISLFPLTPEKMQKLTEEEQGKLDILIYRFTHFQDTLSQKVFSLFLDITVEQPASDMFIDKLNLLERIGIVTDMYEWKDIRELRNHFSHDYTEDFARQAKYLNELHKAVPILISTFERIKERLAQSGVLK